MTDADFKFFEEHGYLILRGHAELGQITALRQRVEDLMQGRRRYEGMFFQRESNRSVTVFSGPSNDYRKIKDLEYDAEFLCFIQNETFQAVSRRYISAPAASMRAMVMNKPPLCPARVPFHQDISDLWDMSAPPVLTIWTALEDATVANGCLQVIPGSHRFGKVGGGHNVDEAELADIVRRTPPLHIELAAGESIVFFNTLIHGSGPNTLPRSRLAFTLCLMDITVVNTKLGRAYPQVHGPGAMTLADVQGLTRVPAHVYDA